MAFVYALTNSNNTVLYIGATSNIKKRIYMHKKSLIREFTQRYNVHKLVHCEYYATMDLARNRETQLKKALRKKKVDLINESNPAWAEINLADVDCASIGD